MFGLLLTFLTQLLPGYADAPVIEITRDDHVATVAMDYNPSAGFGGQLWTVGTDGTDPVGYLLEWWPDPTDTLSMIKGAGCSSDSNTGTLKFATQENPHVLVTAHHVAQLQPLANHLTYHLSVTKLNSLGEKCSPPTVVSFEGGDATRVNNLRSEMTFFDDFNLPMGPADELKWNNAMTPQTDPRFNLFFINAQCHSHTLNGTLNGAAGDKSQVAQRPRKPILIEEGVRRRIVFDMDGIFSPRGVWYLDLNPVNTDLTGHMSFFDSDGDTGLPADVFRIKAIRHEIFVNLINSEGASYNIASAELPDFARGMCPNVRRTFDVRLGVDGVEILVDNVSVINTPFPTGAFKPGIYHLLWSTIGYNTSKDDNPYYLSHWDNFGFDGPDLDEFYVHNYVTRIIGTDLQKSSRSSEREPIFNVEVPDDVRPLQAGVVNDIYLVFTYMKNDFSSFSIQSGDYFLFNGEPFPLPPGANNTSPLVPELVNYAGSTISNRIKIGEARFGEESPLIQGTNTFQFFATNTGIVNLHVEVQCPYGSPEPLYTLPAEIHPFIHHHELPQLGVPAKIIRVNDESLSIDELEDIPTFSGLIPIEILAGNTSWAGWARDWLNVPAQSAEIWSTGNTRGIEKLELYLRPTNMDSTHGYLITSVPTNIDAPTPQSRLTIPLDTRRVVNGEYDLYLMATDSKGIASHPSYDGFGFEWDAEELSGAFKGKRILVSNPVVSSFVFEGTQGDQWTSDGSWDGGLVPPYGYSGTITIDADCVIPAVYQCMIDNGAILQINAGKKLLVRR